MLVLATPQVECLPASTRSQPRWRARVRAQTCAKRVARDPVSHFRWMHAGAGRAGREQAPHARGVRQDDRDAGVGSRQVEGACSGRALLASLAGSCCNTCIQAGMCRTRLSSHFTGAVGPRSARIAQCPAQCSRHAVGPAGMLEPSRRAHTAPARSCCPIMVMAIVCHAR